MTQCVVVVISWENLYFTVLYIDNTLYILTEQSTTSNFNKGNGLFLQISINVFVTDDMFDGDVLNIIFKERYLFFKSVLSIHHLQTNGIYACIYYIISLNLGLNTLFETKNYNEIIK